jgi:hypothetical protein
VPHHRRNEASTARNSRNLKAVNGGVVEKQFYLIFLPKM